MKSNLLLVCFLFSATLFAQRVDNTVSYRNIAGDSYFRFHYDNDFFTAQDLYYTQGYTFELVKPWLKKNPVNYLLVTPAKSSIKYGIAFEQTGFTPNDITAPEILYGDRPFAATIVIKIFVVATDTISKSQIASSLTIGMIGPAAFGNEMQTGIHRWIDDDLPQGWKYQIKNDVAVDYELAYERELISGSLYALGSYAKGRLGTLNTNASVGLSMKMGIMDSGYSAQGKKKFSAYLYAQPMASLIVYDASLQGGLFNKNSPYTIPSSDMERVVLQNNFGLVVKYQAVYLEYSRAVITREFSTGHSHKWGGFRVGFRI